MSCLPWMVCVIESKCPYSCCSVGCCFGDLIKTAPSILILFRVSFFSKHFVRVCSVWFSNGMKWIQVIASKNSVTNTVVFSPSVTFPTNKNPAHSVFMLGWYIHFRKICIHHSCEFSSLKTVFYFKLGC